MTSGQANTRLQFFAYLLIGGINTLGAGAIIFALQATHANPVAANAIGYAMGIVASYLLNSRLTFGVAPNRKSAIRFVVVTGLSWLANLGTVLGVLYLTGKPFLAQACGIPVYTLAGFIGNKYWALRSAKHDAT